MIGRSNLTGGDYYVGDKIKMQNAKFNWEIFNRRGMDKRIYSIATDGYYIYTTGDNMVRKIHRNDYQMWSYEYRDVSPVVSIAVDNRNGNVYVGTDYDEVVGLNSDGNELWTYSGFYGNVEDIAVDQDGYVYAGAGEYIKKLDSKGNLIWIYNDSDWDLRSMAVNQDGYVYFGDVSYYLSKLGYTGSLSVRDFYAGDYVEDIAIDKKGYVYIVTEETVQKIDSKCTGIWSISNQEPSVPYIAVDDEFIYISSGGDKMKKLNNSDGSEVWSYQCGERIHGGIAADNNGRVYLIEGEKVIKGLLTEPYYKILK